MGKKQAKKKQVKRKQVAKKKPKKKRDKHAEQCRVCKSKYRREIEELYINWHPISHVANDYDLEDYTLYRHVRYYKLDDERNKNRENFYHRMMERGSG
ncbi:hypothetical protein KAW55_04565, partial [bacterium]|nr:hypothetical protein [bacterium]